MEERYIQIGDVAMRDRITGELTGEVIPLYTKADEKEIKAREKVFSQFNDMFANMFKQYVDGCREKGIAL